MSPRGERIAPPVARLRIDPAACDGVGVCAHLAARMIELDRWGFPVVDDRSLSRGEVASAERAVRACPRKALWIDRAPEPARSWPPVEASQRP